jgi:signal transduction histidine kinase
VDVTAHVTARRVIERLRAVAERAAELEGAARSAAEGATRQRDHVLAVVAHVLGTPLSAIGICARVLADDESSAAARASSVDLIERCVSSMHRMIRDLSDVASIETGRLALDVRAEAVADLLATTVERFAAPARDAGVELATRAADDVPLIRADRERVVRVLGNLVANALGHTARGGRVTLHAACDPAGVRFTVEDTGVGIAADELPHVFDRFWHARAAAQRGGGLGLPIVRGIVEAHAGTVDVESAPGAGSRFSFTIPAAD